jgi:hypothetical protein
MPRFLHAALAVVLLAAPPQEEGPRWMRSLKRALEVSKERGHPILVWCSTDGEGDNVADQEVMRNKEVQKAMKGFLVCFGDDKDAHGSVPGTIDGKPAKVCKLAPGIACEDHKAIINAVYSAYGDVAVDKSSNMKLPIHFVVDGDGKVIAQINNGSLAAGFTVMPAPKIVDGLKAALSKAGGPGLTDAEYEALQKALAAARNSVEQKRMSEAAKTLAPFMERRKRITLLQDARELLARVDKEAAPALARAQAALKDDPLAGVAGLEKVAEDFPGTESGAAARKAADAFRASPEGKKAVKDLAREKEGRGELDRALQAAGDGKDDGKLLRLLDGIAKKYAGLPCAAEAKAKADAVRSDPERAKALAAAEDERDAKAKLNAAKGLAEAGKTDEARKALQAIVDQHPGTKGAEEARKLLEGLR